MRWFIKSLKNYANFKGRARRKEFWMFKLYFIITVGIALIIDGILAISFGWPAPYFTLFTVISLIIPQLSLIVRRLHDSNNSGWNALIYIIPFLGDLLILLFACLKSDPDENQYGVNPKTKKKTR